MGDPPNGWFMYTVMENPMKMDDLELLWKLCLCFSRDVHGFARHSNCTSWKQACLQFQLITVARVIGFSQFNHQRDIERSNSSLG